MRFYVFMLLLLGGCGNPYRGWVATSPTGQQAYFKCRMIHAQCVANCQQGNIIASSMQKDMSQQIGNSWAMFGCAVSCYHVGEWCMKSSPDLVYKDPYKQHNCPGRAVPGTPVCDTSDPRNKGKERW